MKKRHTPQQPHATPWSSFASVRFMLQISTFIFAGITGSQSSATAVRLMETLPNYSVPVQQFRSFMFALRQSGAAKGNNTDPARSLCHVGIKCFSCTKRFNEKRRLLKFRSSVIGASQLPVRQVLRLTSWWSHDQIWIQNRAASSDP